MTQTDTTNDRIRHIAAVDLGSNSFHMLVVRIVHGDVQTLFKYKERVRLAEGLDAQNQLSDEAIERGVAVLKNFASQLAPLESCEVRVVGTHTLRVAVNRQKFLSEAAKVFPYTIEVIRGQEEARLVYLGVAETEELDGNTLVIDIGGGSTEIVIGANGEMLLGRSHAMGCVSYTHRFFVETVDKKTYKQAKIGAQQQIERFVAVFRKLGWSQVRITSGTAQALVSANTNLKGESTDLTLDGIRALRDLLLDGSQDHKIFKEINEERKFVLLGGLAIMDAVFESLVIEKASFSAGALREGVLREARKQSDDLSVDTRTRSIDSLMARYHVDKDQALRVEATSLRMWDQVAGPWKLKHFTRRYLRYAALTHEIGLDINSSGLHKHSAYILENSNLLGFSVEQQLLIAAVIRQHRKRLRSELIPELLLAPASTTLQLIRVLRLAIIWHINRHPEAPELPILELEGDELTLRLPAEYVEQLPLLVADLEREIELCQQAGIVMKLTFDI